MKLHSALARVVLPVVAAAGSAVIATGTATAATQPDTVRPLTATSCSSVYCVTVHGTGLTVDYVSIVRKDGGTMTGYAYGQDDDDSYFHWTGYFSSTYARVNINRSFSNDSVFCGGVASSQEDADYATSGCVTIHS